MKIKVGIIGSTGYTGVVLVSLLLNHPDIEIVYLSSEQHAGKKYYEIYPSFYGILNLNCKPTNEKEITKNCDLIFIATPHGFSKDFIPKILALKKNIKIIDLSADFRIDTNLKLEKNKKFKIAYGLPELHRSEIKNASIIANPGCYPTSILLGVAPALSKKIIKPETIIIDSKSGVSGAGKAPKQELHFTEINESFSAYSLGGVHRHIGEIENEISKIVEKKIHVVFSPHLLPISRGILSTIYIDLNKNIELKKIHKIYNDFYKDEYFVKVLPENVYSNIKHVRQTNLCHISLFVDKRLNKLIVVSAIDNMVKGASGQAIQNMNIMLGLKENTGLDTTFQIP